MRDVHSTAPDLLLLDIWLSGWNGKEICETLKSQEQTRHLPIVLFSANKENTEVAASVGADGFIAKPFGLEELLSTIKRHPG